MLCFWVFVFVLFLGFLGLLVRGHRNCHWDWLASGSRVREVHDVITHLGVVLGEQVLVNVLIILQGPQQPTCREFHFVICCMNLAFGTGVLLEFRGSFASSSKYGLLVHVQTLVHDDVEETLVVLDHRVSGDVANDIVNLAKLHLQHPRTNAPHSPGGRHWWCSTGGYQWWS